MAKQSPHFTTASREIDRIVKQYVTGRKQVVTNFDSRTTRDLAAARLLICAELEYWLEMTCKSVAESAVEYWKNRRIVTPCMAGLLLYHGGREKAECPATFDHHGKTGESLERALRNYTEVIRRNNGIMEKDFWKLVLPLGYSEADVDPLMLTEFNQFGGKRGSLAHNRRLNAILHIKQPQDLETNIRKIVGLAKPFDSKLYFDWKKFR